jgi:hypothetical protein
MVPHHQVVVTGFQVAIARAAYPDLQVLAQTMLAEQKREIAQIQAWRATRSGAARAEWDGPATSPRHGSPADLMNRDALLGVLVGDPRLRRREITQIDGRSRHLAATSGKQRSRSLRPDGPQNHHRELRYTPCVRTVHNARGVARRSVGRSIDRDSVPATGEESCDDP